MKKVIVYICMLCIIVLAISCGSTRKWRKGLEREWVGQSRASLIAKRGKPTEVNTKDVPGTEILIYIRHYFTPDIPPNNYSEDYFVGKDSLIYKIEVYRW